MRPSCGVTQKLIVPCQAILVQRELTALFAGFPVTQSAEKVDSAEDLVAQALLAVRFCGFIAIRRPEVLRNPHRQECLCDFFHSLYSNRIRKITATPYGR